MDSYDVKRLALILSVQAEVDGMKFENLQREQYNHSHAYTDEDFQSKAAELENLAHASNDQLKL